MKIATVFLFSLVVFCFLSPQKTQAEPWLANRYAQNCSACHSPARRNVAAADRRCTLNCQGCHVNPNGGGMRNQYGVWNQQRWLRSFKSRHLKDKLTPAVNGSQYYGKQPRGGYKKNVPRNGFPLVTTHKVAVNEKKYDKRLAEYKITVKDWREFLQRVTDVDPFRQERSRTVFAGGDLRLITIATLDPKEGQKSVASFPMSFDYGVRIKPATRYLSFVYEGRLMQGPKDNDPIDDMRRLYSGVATTRNAYIMLDQLPYNIYALYGLYRPAFGHLTADHTALAQQLAGFNQRTRHHGITIGAAPNVPYLNVHILRPFEDGQSGDKAQGFATNFGGRFVTLGASIEGAYWRVFDSVADTYLKRELMSLTLGGQINVVTANLNAVWISRQTAVGMTAEGSVYTGEFKIRLWREQYLMTHYAFSPNLTKTLAVGESSDFGFGFKGFMFAGSDIEMLYRLRKGDTETPAVASLQLQAHLYF